MAEPPTYDLATAAADYPPWEGPPLRTVAVCTHMRSGSTLLGEALLQAGVGVPLEYYHLGFRPNLQARWGAASLDAYVAAVRRHRTAPDGVLGLKLFWMDIEDIAHERDPAGQPPRGGRPPQTMREDDYRRLFDLVTDIIPEPTTTFVQLVRRDRVRQAVSHLTAFRTGRWRAIEGQEREALGKADYDYERILQIMAAADYSNAHWANFFSALGVKPYVITYEQLSSDYDGSVGALLRRLGFPCGQLQAPRMRRQSDALTEAMALRFVKEDAGRRP
jgi:LPS sulfotransferase NodH